MKSCTYKFASILPALVTIVSLLSVPLLSGCAGGGTSGTGDLQVITLQGQIITETGSPLEGVEVSDLDGGSSAQTDENGMYSFQTEARIGQELKLLISSEDVNEIRTLTIIEGDEAIIEANIQVSVSSESVIVTSVTVNPMTNEDVEDTSESEFNDSQESDDESEDNELRSVKINGTLESASGELLSGVLVTLRGISSHDTSDRNGQFTLRTTSNKTKFLIRLRYKKFDEEVTLEDLPAAGNLLINIALQINLPATNLPVGSQVDELETTPVIESLSVKKVK